MKKLFLMFAAAMMAASVSAQDNTAITANKFGDNWYFGVNAGITTHVKESFDGADDGMFKAIAPTVGVRLGKNLTTVFGLAAEGNILTQSNDKWNAGSKTFVEALQANLLGTFNLSNLFAGYPGEPRAFELIALGGFGWGHSFCHADKSNTLLSRVALDFAFNLGEAKAWQLYIEPGLNYVLHGWTAGQDRNIPFQYNINNSGLTLKAGLNYKFNTSNGTHNFAKAALRDQAEIDGLNAKINELRADVNAKDGKIAADAQTIADLKAKLAACESRPMQTTIIEEKKETILQPMVIFRQGKSVIEPAQYASVEMVAKYMRNHPESKVIVRGFASPEGNAELNQKLSEARAEAVKTALIKKYKIAADRITTEGLGATDKISEELDFNRVAMFIDTTK